jgi:hypothetical protein
MNETQNQAENANATSTPTAPTPTPTPEVLPATLLVNFPGIVEEGRATAVINYGDELYLFPVGKDDTGKIITASIDSALLRGRGTKRLHKIQTALKIAGRTNDKENQKWFNTEVRDVWHKVLRFAATDALSHGKPVSLGLSIRTSKKTGAQVMTSKHGFEHAIKAPTVAKVETTAAAIADKAPATPEAPKADRVNPLAQAPTPPVAPAKPRKSKIKPLVSVAEAMPTISIAPPVAPENVAA